MKYGSFAQILGGSMRAMWVVKLLKEPTVNDFPHGFFPRKIYYKSDALALQKEVERKGGGATVEREFTIRKVKNAKS